MRVKIPAPCPWADRRVVQVVVGVIGLAARPGIERRPALVSR